MLRTCCSVVDASKTLENISMHANILDMAFKNANNVVVMEVRQYVCHEG